MFIKLLLISQLFVTSIYTLHFTDINGNTIQLSNYQGKKILFVNTASNSLYTSQYAQLEQLYQQYHDSLVVIAFPSNSFGNEPDSDATIKDFVDSNYHAHFILASKVSVSGNDISPVWQWLTKARENGAMDNSVDTDFFKYLVNENGMLVAAFTGSVEPMSDQVKNVVEAW
mgnify:CR=1 FL=1